MGKTNRIVELYANRDQSFNAAIDRIVVEIFNRKNNKTQKLLLSGCSPLAGTTSTCIAIGIAMAETGQKVVLVDCDFRKFLKYKKLNEVTEKGLSDFLLKRKGGEIEASDIIYCTNISGLDFVPCGFCEENPTRVLCSDSFSKLIAFLSEKYDCILFDVPSLATVPDAQVLFPYVDGISLVAALGETKKRHIKDAKRLVAPFAEKYYGMIVNKVSKDLYKNANKDYDYYLVDKGGAQKLQNKIPKSRLGKKKEGNKK